LCPETDVSCSPPVSRQNCRATSRPQCCVGCAFDTNMSPYRWCWIKVPVSRGFPGSGRDRYSRYGAPGKPFVPHMSQKREQIAIKEVGTAAIPASCGRPLFETPDREARGSAIAASSAISAVAWRCLCSGHDCAFLSLMGETMSLGLGTATLRFQMAVMVHKGGRIGTPRDTHLIRASRVPTDA
jgi:hypothetical protein